jgi:hypothetical protein
MRIRFEWLSAPALAHQRAAFSAAAQPRPPGRLETLALIQALKRNRGRFPPDLMFDLSAKKLKRWRSQIVISNPAARMGPRRRPYAFTEQGVTMLSSVLHRERAVS